MTDRDARTRLEQLLRPVEPAGRPALEAVPLSGPRVRGRRLEARVLACIRPEADPLTGHRGSGDALHLAARAGRHVVEVQVRRERGRRVVRGQVFSPGDLAGGLVHVRTQDGVALGCLDASGEFVLDRLPSGALRRLDVELDDVVLGMSLEPRRPGTP